MTLPNRLDRWPGANCEVKIRDVCQWKETSGDQSFGARGELPSLKFHLPAIL